MAGKRLSPEWRVWIDERQRFHLSHAQVQMARELGLNPRRFDKLANTSQEPWKVPLPRYIEELYLKHFKKPKPDQVRSIEQLVADRATRPIS